MMFGVIAVVEEKPVVDFSVAAHAPGDRFVWVRAVVPAAAGALRIPLWEVTAIFTIASGLWYGIISWIAFRVGEDWATVRHTFEVVARDVGIGAIGISLVMVLIGWRLWKRHVARTKAPPAA